MDQMAASACQWFGDGDDINIFILEQLADVGVTLDRLAGIGALFGFPLQNLPVHITKGDQANPVEFAKPFDVIAAPAAKADDGHTDVAIGAALSFGDIREKAERTCG
jgi:hypothetical protein